MKAINILTTYDALSILADKDLDLNTACNIAKNIKNLETSKNVIEQKRMNLIQEYGEKDDNGNIIQSEDGQVKILNMNEFTKKITELMDSDVEIDLVKIKVSALADVKISPRNVAGLEEVLDYEE